MTAKKIALSVFSAILFAAGLAGLFPARATELLARAGNMYTVGFSADSAGWHALGVLGGGALVAGAWVLSSALRRSS